MYIYNVGVMVHYRLCKPRYRNIVIFHPFDSRLWFQRVDSWGKPYVEKENATIVKMLVYASETVEYRFVGRQIADNMEQWYGSIKVFIKIEIRNIAHNGVKILDVFCFSISYHTFWLLNAGNIPVFLG